MQDFHDRWHFVLHLRWLTAWLYSALSNRQYPFLVLNLQVPEGSAAEYVAAVLSLKQCAIREELEISELDAPFDIAEKAIAFSAEIKQSEIGSKAGTGRFVLFWSPTPQENWTSNFRVVCFARSPLETDIGKESDSSHVTWDWLTTALANSGAGYSSLAGTTTRIISSGHGMMEHQDEYAEIEIRASWSPDSTEIHRHFEAWQNLICVMSNYTIAPGVENPKFDAR